MSAATEAGKAAELIGFALQPKISRGADQRYSELWSEYRSDVGSATSSRPSPRDWVSSWSTPRTRA